jgi:hypothetical protein
MSYTGNHRIDAVLLVVINDGDGSQCGTDYEGRLILTRYSSDQWPWNLMMRRAARHTNADTLVNITREEVLEGGRFLRDYYRDLLKEGA